MESFGILWNLLESFEIFGNQSSLEFLGVPRSFLVICFELFEYLGRLRTRASRVLFLTKIARIFFLKCIDRSKDFFILE